MMESSPLTIRMIAPVHKAKVGDVHTLRLAHLPGSPSVVLGRVVQVDDETEKVYYDTRLSVEDFEAIARGELGSLAPPSASCGPESDIEWSLCRCQPQS